MNAILRRQPDLNDVAWAKVRRWAKEISSDAIALVQILDSWYDHQGKPTAKTLSQTVEMLVDSIKAKVAEMPGKSFV